MIKVKELIEILKKHDPEKPVVVDYMDHTDWWYVCELDEEDISLNDVCVNDEAREELGLEEDHDKEWFNSDVEVLTITLNENKSINHF